MVSNKQVIGANTRYRYRIIDSGKTRPRGIDSGEIEKKNNQIQPLASRTVTVQTCQLPLFLAPVALSGFLLAIVEVTFLSERIVSACVGSP